ncbi:MAG: hypothetical protein WBD31_17740 [Rubripirellula sp.]
MADELILAVCDCGKTLKVKPSYAGKKVRCPSCNAGVLIESPSSTAAKSPGSNRADSTKPTSKKSDAKKAVADEPAEDAFSFLQGGESGKSDSNPVIDINVDASAKSTKRKDKVAKAPVVVDPQGESDRGESKSMGKQAAVKADADADADVQGDGRASSPILAPVTGAATVASAEILKDSTTTPPPGNHSGTASTDVHPTAGWQPREYPMLDIISFLYRISAYVVLVGALVVAAIAMGYAKYNGSSDLVVGLASAPPMLFGGILGMTMLAISEGIKLMLDIQDNTHRAANRD